MVPRRSPSRRAAETQFLAGRAGPPSAIRHHPRRGAVLRASPTPLRLEGHANGYYRFGRDQGRLVVAHRLHPCGDRFGGGARQPGTLSRRGRRQWRRRLRAVLHPLHPPHRRSGAPVGDADRTARPGRRTRKLPPHGRAIGCLERLGMGCRAGRALGLPSPRLLLRDRRLGSLLYRHLLRRPVPDRPHRRRLPGRSSRRGGRIVSNNDRQRKR